LGVQHDELGTVAIATAVNLLLATAVATNAKDLAVSLTGDQQVQVQPA
jgi:hypothetical protein